MPTTPPLLSHPSPQVPPRAARTLPPLPYSAVPATRPACAARLPSPVRPLLRHPDSAQTASVAATKTKIRQSAAALPASTPTRAAAFPLPDAPYTFREPFFPAQIACRLFSSNLFPTVPAAL